MEEIEKIRREKCRSCAFYEEPALCPDDCAVIAEMEEIMKKE
ncbi:MAG: hypothetical protein ACXQS1_05825 [Methermicoccaceae archaeon]